MPKFSEDHTGNVVFFVETQGFLYSKQLSRLEPISWFDLNSIFNGVSNIMGYLMPKPSYWSAVDQNCDG